MIETGRVLRVGTFNLGDGRNVVDTIAGVFGLMRRERLDALALQELVRYGDELELEARRRGMKLVRFGVERRDLAKLDEGILVAKDVEDSHGRCLTLYGFPDATPHGPESATVVVLDGWLRVLSIHRAPGVEWWNGEPRGPAGRVRATVRGALRLRAFVFWRRVRPLAILGDWNESPNTTGRATPRQIAAKIGGTIVAPAIGTHGRRSRPPIDYGIFRGVRARVLRVIPNLGSDHAAVIYEIREVVEP